MNTGKHSAAPDATEKMNETLSNGSSFTMETWVYQKEEGFYNTIIGKGDHQATIRTMGKDYVTFYIYNGAWIQNDFTMPSDWIGKWHHLAAVVDGTDMRVYCDSVELACPNKKAITGEIRESDEPFGVVFESEHMGSRDGKNKPRLFTAMP